MGADSVLVGPDTPTNVERVAVDPSETLGSKLASVRETRAAKIAAASASLSKAVDSDAGAVVADPPVVASKPPAATAPVPEVKDEEAPPDEKTARALELIEKRDKRARDKLAEERAKIDTERTNLEKLRAELEKSKPPLEDLKKLPAQRRYAEALKLAGIDPDDEEIMDIVARDAYARSKSGKADPKNRAYADQIADRHSVDSRIAQLERELAETRNGLTERERAAADEQYQTRYIDAAVKAIPAEPSLTARAHARNPERTRGELLHVARSLMQEIGEEPTHAEVVERYEKLLRQDLSDRGLDDAQIAAMLAPANPAATPVAPTKSRTIDPAAGSPTKPLNANPTRAEKLAMAGAELRKRRMES